MKSIYFKKCLYMIGISSMIVIVNSVLALHIIKLPDKSEIVNFNFNLITINSIIAGFSFTTLGIILGLSGSELIIKISKTNIMSDKSKIIITSIVYCCASIITSMIFVLQLHDSIIYRIIDIIFIDQNVQLLVYNIVLELLYTICIVFLFGGLKFFLKSIREVSRLIMKIYKNKSKLSPEKVNEIKSALSRKTTEDNTCEHDVGIFTKE